MRKYIRTLKAQYAVAVLAGALLVGGGTAVFQQDAFGKDKAATPVRVTVDQTPVQREKQMVTSFSSVVKKVSPSVVKVYTTFAAKEGGSPVTNPFADDPMFRRFFGEQFGREGLRRNPQPKQTGVGS